jgi:hypothetical protein
MGKEHTKDLLKFLKPFTPEIRKTTLWLREFVWDLYPDCNELIYDNYNAVAFGWGLSDRLQDVFCSVAVYGKGVNLGFNRGSEIPDVKKILLGNGSLYRFIRAENEIDFPKAYAKKLLKYAHTHAKVRMKEKGGTQLLKGTTIVKSISPKKRRPKK